MLEANTFLVVRRNASPRSIRLYDLTDASGNHLGRVAEWLGPLARFGRRLGFPDHCFTSRIDFLEPPDESLVFTMSSARFADQVIVRDALGDFVGATRPFRGCLQIVDRRGLPLGELHPSDGKSSSIRNAERERELGQMTWTNPSGFRLDITEELTDQPVVKMLLLAAAFTTELRGHAQG